MGVERPDPQPPHRLKRRLNPHVIHQIVEEYNAGATTPDLCRKFQLSKGGMLGLLRENGAVMRRQKLTAEQGVEAVHLYAQGLAIAPIADQLGTSYSNVRTCLIEAGIERRPRGGSYR